VLGPVVIGELRVSSDQVALTHYNRKKNKSKSSVVVRHAQEISYLQPCVNW
jgi:hypothetical protein